jgi:hypothetical protein
MSATQEPIEAMIVEFNRPNRQMAQPLTEDGERPVRRIAGGTA